MVVAFLHRAMVALSLVIMEGKEILKRPIVTCWGARNRDAARCQFLCF